MAAQTWTVDEDPNRGGHERILAALPPLYLSDYEFAIRLSCMGIPLVIDENVSLVADRSIGGEQEFTGSGLRSYLRHALPNRARYNPKRWLALALLVCPPPRAAILLARIWVGFALRGLRIALRPTSVTR